jgi:lipopolysaccharide transport system ATP-binding protein
MGEVAIDVRELAKAYRIGQRAARSDTLIGASLGWLRAPVRRFRDLRGLTVGDGADSTTHWALRDVTFSVAHGEVLGLIGHNGAGKSTLLKILSRIAKPTSGTATLEGKVSSLLEVGTGFHPELTGRENIYLNGTVLGMRRHEIERRFDEIVAFSSIDKYIDTPVKRYSSGMQVRLAFAVAAHLRPDVLLVDEVLAVGDAAFQEKCLSKLDTVAEEGRTVIFVSHNLASIRQICGRALLLDRGRLVADGPPGQVIAKYLESSDEPSAAGIDLVRSDDIVVHSFATRQYGNDSSLIVGRDEFAIDIEYSLYYEGADLLLGVDLFSGDGSHLFRSYDLLAEPSSGRTSGRYRSRLVIPPALLSGGVYFAQLLVGIHRQYWISRGDCRVSIRIESTREVDVNLPGVLSPQGTWTVEALA